MSMPGLNIGIQYLPDEVLVVIFKYVELDDKKKARLVCHRWRLILDCSCLIYNATLCNENAKHFFKSYREFNQVEVSGMTARIPRMSSEKHEFPRIEEIDLMRNNSQAVTKNFLKYGCANTKSLNIHDDAFANIRRYVISATLRQTTWDFLTTLYLCVCTPNLNRKSKRTTDELLTRRNNQFDSGSTFLKHARLPALQDFTLGLSGFRVTPKLRRRFNTLFINFYNFLRIHSETLKALCLGSFGRKSHVLLPGPGPEVEPVNLNLEKIFFSSIPLEHFNCLGLCGTQLKDFCLFLPFPMNQNQLSVLQRALEANAATLESVYLNTHSEILIRWLKSCNRLESLRLSVRRDGVDMIVWEEGMEFPNLKKLESEVLAIDLSPGLQRLISENETTLQELELGFDVFPQNELTSWDWLEGCKALRSLKLHVLDVNTDDEDIDFSNVFGFYLPQVSQAEITISYLDQSQICIRLILALPNLEVVTFEQEFVGLHGIQAMINAMQKLKKITLGNHCYALDTMEEFRNYVQETIGVKIDETGFRAGDFLEEQAVCTTTIYIDRSQFVPQTQPVTN